MPGSIYTNGYLTALAHVVPYIITGPIANGFGRKKSMILGFFISGLASLLFEPLSFLNTSCSYICLVSGTFGTICAFSLVYIVTTEVFPTTFRGFVFGLSNVVGRVGGIRKSSALGKSKRVMSLNKSSEVRLGPNVYYKLEEDDYKGN